MRRNCRARRARDVLAGHPIMLEAIKSKPVGLVSSEKKKGALRITPALTLLFAIAAGAAVGNLYSAQPLLADIAAAMQVSVVAVSILITFTQVGYALGVFLIVPLGDTLSRRRLIPIIMTCSAIALGACAAAPTFPALLAALAAVGLTTVSGQLLTPFAGDLAEPSQRGRVIGTIVSGILSGILLSRTISGLVADRFGWRAIYVFSSLLMLTLAAVLARVLPPEVPRPPVSYPKLLLSVLAAVKQHRRAQVTVVITAIAFATFSLFWTSITFLLSAPPFSFSVAQIGLVGLVGLAGALAARNVGRLHDRGRSSEATGAALALALLSLFIAGVGSQSIVAVLLAVLLFDVALQATNVLNQTRMLSIDPAARSRLNTAYVVSNFIGGAIGSSMAGLLWKQGGWSLTMLGAGLLIGLALLVWASQRKALGST
jgi:predicted MFS family arabinose efflux permease